MLKHLRNRKRNCVRMLVFAMLLNNFLPIVAQVQQQYNEDEQAANVLISLLVHLHYIVAQVQQQYNEDEQAANVLISLLGTSWQLRAPRPGAPTGLEGETLSDQGTAVCCELPRDVAITGTLNVGGNLIVQGNIITPTAALSGRTLTLFEDPSNGTDAITIEAPASLAASYGMILPPDAGLVNQVLTTDGAGTLSWQTVGASVGAFVQGGNTFTAEGVLGTNDNYGLSIRTNATERINISNAGTITVADLVGTDDRLVEASATGVLQARIPVGTKNVIYVIKDIPVVTGKYYPILKDAVDWANANAAVPTAIVIAPGSHVIDNTITVINTNLRSIVGVEASATVLVPSAALIGQPVLVLNQAPSFIPFTLQETLINGASTVGYSTTPGSVGVVVSGDSRYVLDFFYISGCYRGLEVTGGSGSGSQLVAINNSFISFCNDCGILVDNGARVILSDAVISESSGQQIRLERTNIAAATTRLSVFGGQISSEILGTGDGILLKDTSEAIISTLVAFDLQNIFTVQDAATLICANNIQVEGTSTNYRQLSSTARIIVNGDVVSDTSSSKFVITNSNNASFNFVERDTGEHLVGSFADANNQLMTVLTGHGVDDPNWRFEDNWFGGYRGTIFEYPENSLTGISGAMNVTSAFNKNVTASLLIRGLNAHSFTSSVGLASYETNGDPAVPNLALLRLWHLQKKATTQNFALDFWNGAGSANALTITPTGDVGIGTTAPTSKLEVAAGQVAVSAGTAANPAYTFIGDLDTGIYSPAANTVALTTAGSTKLSINGSTITIPGLASAGVVHTNGSGDLSTSLIVNNDITNLTITDAKLQPITTAGKVANTATTATAANLANTIVLRDGSGNFVAGTITGTLSGAASANVLKAGDTMTGPLLMSNQNQVRFGDSGSNYVALQAPATVPTSYTISLPTDAGTNGQVLTTNGSGVTSWSSPGTLPGFIAQGGNTFGAAVTIGAQDNFGLNLITNNTNRLQISNAGVVNIANCAGTGDRVVEASATGDLSAIVPTGIKNIVQVIKNSPTVVGKFYASIKDAVDWANANATEPTAIVISPGVYIATATISVTNNFVRAVVGTQASAVNVVPSPALAGNPVFLFAQTSSAIPFEIRNITVSGIGVPGWGTTVGSRAFTVTGFGNFAFNGVFGYGCYQNFAFLGSGSSNVQAITVNSCASVAATDCCMLVDDGARLTLVNSILATPGTQALRVQKTSVTAPQTSVYGVTCQVYNDVTMTGTAILVKDTAFANIVNFNFRNLEYIFAVQDSGTLECVNNIDVNGSVKNYQQLTATANLLVNGDLVEDAHNASKYVVTNSANASFNIIDADGDTLIGNFSDADSPIFAIFDGHGADDPHLSFKEDWFGTRGLVYESPAASLSDVSGGMSIASAIDKNAAMGSLVRGASAASYVPALTLATYASASDPSTPDLSLLRRWTLAKDAATDNLSMSFWNGATESTKVSVDSTGNVGIGTSTPASKLEVASGQIAAPAGTAANPAYTHSSDLNTGIYFPASDTLGFATAGLQRMTINSSGIVAIPELNTAGVVHNDASGNLSTSLIANSDIPNLTITDAKLQQITSANKVANSATTATSANTANAIVARDASGNFSAGTISAAFSGALTGNVTGSASLNVLKTGDIMTGSLVLSGGSTDLTVSGTTNVQGININGNLHALSTSYFDMGIPGIPANELIVTTGPLSGPNQFNSIKAAIDSISGNSQFNPFVVKVGPGVYLEDPMTLKSFVTLTAESPLSVIIAPNNPAADLITAEPYSIMSDVQLTGVTGSGKAAYRFNGGGIVAVESCIFNGCDTFINIDSTNAPYSTAYVIDTFLDESADFVTAIKIRSTGGYPASCTVNTLVWQGVSNGTIDSIIDISGAPCRLFAGTLDIASIGMTGTGVKIADGAIARIRASALKNFATGILVENTGAGAFVDISGVSGVSNTVDLNIAHPGATGVIQAEFEYSKVILDPSADVAVFLLDPVNRGTVTVGPEYYGNTVGLVTNISPEIEQGSCLGVLSGGVISDAGSLDVSVTAGTGYLMVGSAPNDNLKYVTWNTQTITLPANADSFVYIDNAGVLQSSLGRPDSLTTILIGKATTESASIAFLQVVPGDGTHTGNGVDETLRQGFGPVYKSGSLVSKNGDLQLDVTSGSYFFGTINYLPAGGTAISWEAFYQDGSGGETIINGQNMVDYDHYDDGSGTLALIPSGDYARHAFYVVNDGANEKYLLVYGQTTYTTLIAAQNGDVPPAPGTWTDNIALIASIIVQNTATPANQIAEIRDERPRLGFKASGVSVITEHNDLSGRLLDSCHPQYLLLSGTSPMSGNLDMGTNNVINAGTYNSVTVQAHAARHLPNGADPLTTATPVTINTSNSEGIANSFARSDHVHAHGNQTDPNLHAVATTSTAGFMSAADKTLLDSLDPSLYVLKTGSTMTGGLIINPAAGNALQVNTNKFIVGATTGNTTIGGTLTLSPLTTAGILHNNASGLVTSSLIVNADVDPAAAIDDTKLATIVTSGKVDNSATTADSANTASAIVARDGSGNFNAGSITLENQGQLCLQESTVNGTDTICLQAPADVTPYTFTLPATAGTAGYVLKTDGSGVTDWVTPASLSGIVLTGGNTVAAPLSIGTANDFALNLITNGTTRLSIANSVGSGAITIPNLASTGIVHTNGSGLLSTSLIVNADVSPIAAIADTKLATIVTSGKVANSATTADSANTPSSIVARDGSGNFSAGIITATFSGNLTGNVTGAASLNVLKAGDTMTGNLVMGNQTQVRLTELTSNGTNYIALRAPASVTSDTVLTFPDGAGSSGQVLTTDGVGVLSWTTATDANTASAIVKRDASGNFSAGTITANLSGNATTATTATTATNFSGSLSGDVTGTQGATVVAFVGGQSAANVAAATVLANNATDANTPSAIVRRDASGNFSAGSITADLTGNVTGSASNNVLKAGDTMTGTLVMDNQQQIRFAEQTINGSKYIALRAPSAVTANTVLTLPDGAGSADQVLTTNGSGVTSWQSATALPGLVLVGGNSPASALSIGTANDFALNLITNGTTRLSIADSIGGGAITIPSLASTGIVHTNGSGLLSTSLIVNADISAIAAIDDSKLATITSTGKVDNSATTATSANTASAIVARDGSGNFSAGIITASFSGNLTGNVTGSASNNVLKAGDTMTGNLVMDNQKQIRLRELTTNGANYIALQAPASVTADTVLTFPDGAGSSGQVLTTDGTGVLSWSSTVFPSSVAQGDLLYGSATNTLSTLAKNTTATRYLANTGTNNNPNWDQVNLTNGVTGTLPVGNGGTGATTFTSNGVLYGNGTGAIQVTAQGAANTVLLGNGGVPSFGAVPNAALANSSITLSNGNNITVTGSPVSLGGSATIALTGTTNRAVQIGNASGSLTSLGVGTAGQVLLSGGASADPAFVTPTAGTGLTITTNATTLQYALSTPVSVSNGGTGATTLTAHGVLIGEGTSAVAATSAGTSGQLLQSGGASADPNWTTSTYPSTNAQGDLIYGSATNTLSTLAKNTTATRYLANTGTNNNPNWDQVNLANGVTGTLPVGNGGTGATTFTSNGVLYGNGTGALQVTAQGAANTVLLGNGGVPSFGAVPNAALANSSITLSNGNNITVTGSPVSLGGSATIALTGTTNRAVQIGNASGSLTSLATGTSGQLLQSGGASVDPAWTSSTYPSATAQGDLMYASAANTLTTLAKSTTATRYLANTGTSNNPNWDQINLANGVTGTLPNGNTTATSANTASAIVARDGSGNFSAGTITASLTGAASLNVLKAGDTMTGNLVMDNQTQIQLRELTTNGTNYIALRAPAAVTADTTLTFPNGAGSSGQALTTDGTGILSWTTVATSANTFLNGGNTFGGAATLGTNDSNTLTLRTNNTVRLTIDASGNTTFTSNYKAAAYRGANQTISGASFQAIQFNTELFDPNNNYDNVTTFAYTAPVTGYYTFSANVSKTTINSAGTKSIQLFKDTGGGFAAVTGYIASSADSTSVFSPLTLMGIVQMNANDRIQIQYRGANNDVITSGSSFYVAFLSI